MTETVTVRKDDLRLLMEAATTPSLIFDPAVVPLQEALTRCGEALNGTEENATPPAANAPPGEYGRVELPGYVAWEGWISEGTFAGAGVLVVRDAAGTVVARVSPNAYRQIVPLPVPVPVPERPALTGPPPSWAAEWDSSEDAAYDDDQGGVAL